MYISRQQLFVVCGSGGMGGELKVGIKRGQFSYYSVVMGQRAGAATFAGKR